MVKGNSRRPPFQGIAMLISEFARITELPPDTIRFYVRRGLLRPLTGTKGGANPYQVFTEQHVQVARAIRMAQSLGFSLREIAALNVEYEQKRLTRSAAPKFSRATRAVEGKSRPYFGDQLHHAKTAWVDSGAKGPEPNFTDYEPGAPGVKLNLHGPKRAKATKSIGKQRSRRTRAA